MIRGDVVSTTIKAPELVFESETIENIPSGWRARERYRFLTVDRFEKIFELAEPGMECTPYSRCELSRA